VIVSKKKIDSIMSTMGLKAKVSKRFRLVTTNSKHNYAISPNRLKQEFIVDEPNRVFVGDITYIKTLDGFVYLATVIDLYSRKIVGWSITDNMKTSIVNNAPNMAITRRSLQSRVIYHTDKGSQYASSSHRKLLQKYGFIQSMSGKGNCYVLVLALSMRMLLQRAFLEL
jgi:transposase InsO family protein